MAHPHAGDAGAAGVIRRRRLPGASRMIDYLLALQMQDGMTFWYTVTGLLGDFRPRRGHPPSYMGAFEGQCFVRESDAPGKSPFPTRGTPQRQGCPRGCISPRMEHPSGCDERSESPRSVRGDNSTLVLVRNRPLPKAPLPQPGKTRITTARPREWAPLPARNPSFLPVSSPPDTLPSPTPP